MARLKLTLRGAVQGVGFRPFVYRLATELGLSGWVNNSPLGVFIEVEGAPARLEEFRARLETDKPPRSSIHSLEAAWLDPVGHAGFEIRASEIGGEKSALVLPDIATCPDCLREIFDASNRRYRYPFTNCTNCGPRFSIIEALPYDRANTSMKRFAMCPACQAEYDAPRDRRFHAQPNACPACGPQLELWDRTGKALETRRAALLGAAQAIREGRVVAVKGLGGFHLMVAAHDESAVRRLRERKHREEKPLALMFPSLDSVKAVCEVSAAEQRLLECSEAPIVLLRRRSGETQSVPGPGLAPGIAPGNPNLAAMLPYTPLHHLLLRELGFAVVATSGNVSDEPICTDEREALSRLGEMADVFLVHDRPIVRHVDDSIVRVMLGREMALRRARGYAPLPVQIGSSRRKEALTSEPAAHRADSALDQSLLTSAATTVLAVGAHLKNAVALSIGPQVFVSQHIGDLETEEAFSAFRRVIADLQRIYEVRPAVVAADLHPDYLSTQFARELAAGADGPRLLGVQHHLAHVLACMADNELEPPVLGVSWDGTGYGPDGTIWGGEFFLVTAESAKRVAHLRPFRLPGGDAAVKEPRRAALGLLYEWLGAAAFERADLQTLRAFEPAELAALRTMIDRGLNAPFTSSAGRLFDAVASLIGLRQRMRFEGQAAMELEFALDDTPASTAYPLALSEPAGTGPLVLDWAPMIEALLADLRRGLPVNEISARLHAGLADGIVMVARRIGVPRVALSGGCFQNRRLSQEAVERLRTAGFQPYWHQRVPPNDGGIALGQVVAARWPTGGGLTLSF